MGAHQVTHFQYYSPELLIIAGYRRLLPQVKQASLVAEGMVQITEFGFKCMAEILLCAYTKLCPTLIGYRLPPGQSLAHQQGDSDFDNLRGLCHACHFTEVLDVERPVCQLLSVTIYFSGFFNLMLELAKVPGPVVAGGAGGAGGGACCAAIYTACQCSITLLMRSFAIYGTLSET